MNIQVARILEDQEFDLRLKLVAGRVGLSREIRHTRPESPGLALAGEISFMDPDRVQVLGGNELGYLQGLPPERRAEIIRLVFSGEPACLVLVDDLPVPEYMKEEAERRNVPLLSSSLRFSVLTDRLTDLLQEHLGEACTVHGVLVDVVGVGVLILGKSGIGKSECALDLVLRGHRLVADDVVYLKKLSPAGLFGSCSEILEHHLEIRGLGIINIKDLYGISAVRDRKKVELVVELVDWQELEESDRLGMEERTYDILGVELPFRVVPVRPGRNVCTIVEVAARDSLLKRQGHHSAREFQQKLNRVISEASNPRVLGKEVE